MTAEPVLPESSRLSGSHRLSLKSAARPERTSIGSDWGSRLAILAVLALILANLIFWGISFSR